MLGEARCVAPTLGNPTVRRFGPSWRRLKSGGGTSGGTAEPEQAAELAMARLLAVLSVAASSTTTPAEAVRYIHRTAFFLDAAPGSAPMSSEPLPPATGQAPSNRQRLFARYFMAILVDLVVLNLFAEYSRHVAVDSFTTSLVVAVVLQVLLRLTMATEQRVAAFFKAREGRLMVFLRFFCAWLVMFGSKFVILEAVALASGGKVRFDGPFYGLAWLIVVLATMVCAEQAVVRLYRRLEER